MDNIGVINPESGEVHYVPYADLGAAMEAGGHFADESQKQKAIDIQSSQESNPSEGNVSRETSIREKPNESTGFKGLAADTIESLRGALKGGIGFLGRVPANLTGIKEEFQKSPIAESAHAAGQLGVGAAEFAKSLANSGLGLLQSPLDRKLGMPELKIGDTGLQNALGLQSNKKGDELIKAIPDIASALYGGGSLLKGGYKYLTRPFKVSEAKRAENVIAERLEEAKAIKGASKEDLDKLKQDLEEKFSTQFPNAKEGVGKLTASGQRVAQTNKTGAISELNETAAIPEKKVGEIPLKPNTDAIIAKTKEAETKATDALSQALKSHENIPLKAGSIIQKHVKTLHDEASKLYNKVESAYKGKDIPVNNTQKINETAGELDKLIQEDLASGESIAPGYGSGTSEQKALEAKINALKNETVSASDVYDVQRTMQNRAQKARDASFGPKLDKIERTRLQKLAARHESAAIKLGKVLENVGDPDTKAMLKAANQGWKTYKDISRSKVGKSILRNEGQIPADTMLKIEGTGEGNKHLRALAKADPELGRYLFGQKYGKAAEHKKIFEKSDLTEAYLKHLPAEVQDKVTNLKVALKGVSEGKSEVKEAKSAYRDLVKSMTEEANKQEARATAVKQQKHLNEQIKFHKDAEKKLETQIDDYKSKGKDVTQLSRDLAKHRRESTEVKTKLDQLTKLGLKALGLKGASDILSSH